MHERKESLYRMIAGREIASRSGHYISFVRPYHENFISFTAVGSDVAVTCKIGFGACIKA